MIPLNIKATIKDKEMLLEFPDNAAVLRFKAFLDAMANLTEE